MVIGNSSLTPEVQQDLQQQLRRHLDDIKKKYASYVRCVRTTIEKKGIGVSELRTYLLDQSVFDYNDKNYKLFADKKTELKEAVEVNDIFDLINLEFANFLNIQIFEQLVSEYSLNEGQEELKYPDHLKEYIYKLQISELIKSNPALTHPDPTSSKPFTLKLDIKPTSKVAKIQELSDAIADIMGWSLKTMRIYGIEEGCVVVKFFIPTFFSRYGVYQ